jgi:hypothetical protein
METILQGNIQSSRTHFFKMFLMNLRIQNILIPESITYPVLTKQKRTFLQERDPKRP